MVPAIDAIDKAIDKFAHQTKHNHVTSKDVVAGGEKAVRKILSLRMELCNIISELAVTTAPPSSTSTSETEITSSVAEKASASVSPQSTRSPSEIVAETLDSFFASMTPKYGNLSDVPKNSETMLRRGITPLMVACDTGNLACLRYFCNKLEAEVTNDDNGGPTHPIIDILGKWLFWEVLIGNPLRSRTAPEGNLALHHSTTEAAAKAEEESCTDGDGTSFLELLERIAIAQDRLEHKAGGVPGSEPGENVILALGAAVNAHGDTPLMMAAAKNVSLPNGPSGKRFLERWHDLALERSNSCPPSSRYEQLRTIKSVLRTKNKSGGWILPYAWAHGIVDIVRWLINVDRTSSSTGCGDVIISADDAIQFRQAMGVMEYHWSRFENTSQAIDRETYEEKRERNEECTGLLEAHVAERSEQIARELLEEEAERSEQIARELLEEELRDNDDGDGGGGGNGTNRSNRSGKKKKKKKKKKKQQQQQKQQQQPQSQHSKSQQSNEEESKSIHSIEPVVVGEEKHVSESEQKQANQDSVVCTSSKESLQNANDDCGNDTPTRSDTESTRSNTLTFIKLANGRLAVNVPGFPVEEAAAKAWQPQPPSEEINESNLSQEPVVVEKEKPVSGGKQKQADQDSVVGTNRKASPSGANYGWGPSRSGPKSNGSSVLLFTKTANEMRDVRVPSLLKEEETATDPSVLPSPMHRKRTMSLDETNQLLRDRYRLGSITKALSPAQQLTPFCNGSGQGPATMVVPDPSTSDTDSILSALCLDVNCLLYSHHGMALNLSPAQLDAVEHILREQLESVKKARAIQERRCKGGNATVLPGPHY